MSRCMQCLAQSGCYCFHPLPPGTSGSALMETVLAVSEDVNPREEARSPFPRPQPWLEQDYLAQTGAPQGLHPAARPALQAHSTIWGRGTLGLIAPA